MSNLNEGLVSDEGVTKFYGLRAYFKSRDFGFWRGGKDFKTGVYTAVLEDFKIYSTKAGGKRPLLKQALSFWVSLGLSMVLVACQAERPSNKSGDRATKKCALAADQSDSLMAEVPQFPLLLHVDKKFSEDENHEIMLAAREWNSIGQSLINRDLVQIASPSEIGIFHRGQKGSVNDCSIEIWGEHEFILIKEDNLDHWQSLGFSKSIPGATGRCFQGGWVRNQVILVYPELANSAQFSSIVVHELGHSFGLDHSCTEGNGRPTYRGCKGLDSFHPYRLAVMFPTLRLGATERGAEIKETPQENDRARVGCLVESR